jgi:hypothetical protein
MKLKLDADGHVVLQDGKPVYVHDDGKEVAFDAASTVATISRLNGEAKGHRERAEAAEGKLKGFEGIDRSRRPEGRSRYVKNLDEEARRRRQGRGDQARRRSKAYKDQARRCRQGHAEELRSSRASATRSSTATTPRRSRRVQGLQVHRREGRRSRRHRRGQVRRAFKVEDGKIVAYDGSGNKVYSRTKPGDLADFDEALETLVDSYPHRDQILKGVGAGWRRSADNGNGAGGRGDDPRRVRLHAARAGGCEIQRRLVPQGLAALALIPAGGLDELGARPGWANPRKLNLLNFD